MADRDHQAKLDQLVQRASEMLGSPGRIVVLDWRMEHLLREAAVFETRRGLVGESPVQVFDQGRRGHSTYVGLERWRLDIDGRPFHAVKIYDGLGQVLTDPSVETWVFPAKDYKEIYRHLRQLCRDEETENTPPPVMREEDKTRLWENTVGFLLRGDELLGRRVHPPPVPVDEAGAGGEGGEEEERQHRGDDQRGGLPHGAPNGRSAGSHRAVAGPR